MYFKVSACAEGKPRDGAMPPEFADAIPAGFFTTRFVAARDAEAAEKSTRAILSAEIEAFGFWSDYSVAIEALEAVSFVEYALNARRKGASWYAE